MASKERYTPKTQNDIQAVLFENVEEAWFWFIRAQEAKNDGARFVSGVSAEPRPCEPIDILKALDRLYRQRRVMRDHLLVLRHYGRRFLAPDPSRVKEARAHTLWSEALERLHSVLELKGIVQPRGPLIPHDSWHTQAYVLDGRAVK